MAVLHMAVLHMALLIQWLTSRENRRSRPLLFLSNRLALLVPFFWSLVRIRE
jgi:hypothetical protein